MTTDRKSVPREPTPDEIERGMDYVLRAGVPQAHDYGFIKLLLEHVYRAAPDQPAAPSDPTGAEEFCEGVAEYMAKRQPAAPSAEMTPETARDIVARNLHIMEARPISEWAAPPALDQPAAAPPKNCRDTGPRGPVAWCDMCCAGDYARCRYIVHADPDQPAAPSAEPRQFPCDFCGSAEHLTADHLAAGRAARLAPPSSEDADLCARLRGGDWTLNKLLAARIEAAAALEAKDAEIERLERELSSLRADVAHWGRP